MKTNKIIQGSIENVFDLIREFHESNIKAKDIIVLVSDDEYVEIINKEFQKIYDIGNKYVIDNKEIKWMIGDRVISTKNNYDINIYNGQIGTVKDIDNNKINIDFEGGTYYDCILNSNEIQHGYCIPIYKSNGCVWPYVITFISCFINQDYLYTAMTRNTITGYLIVTDNDYINKLLHPIYSDDSIKIEY